MNTYTTEITINNIKYNGPKIQANSFLLKRRKKFIIYLIK